MKRQGRDLPEKESRMTRKERMDLLLKKVPKDRQEKFVAALRKAASKEDRTEVLQRFGVTLTKEEFLAFARSAHEELNAADLRSVAGGANLQEGGSCFGWS